MKHLSAWLMVSALLLAPLWGQAAEPTVTSNDLPRIPAVPPQQALKTFQLKPGFQIRLAAHEPTVVSPVALSFDEDGRLFVVEMIDYSERREETPHPGRIRRLEDADGDGFYEKSTVFADNLPWPTAVFCYGGGIFVGATPDIYFLKDTNGDGKADVREVVFSGFAEGVKRLNVQAMLNSFIWGLDNRIHGATSGNGGTVKSLKHADTKPLSLNGRDFAIEPRAMTISSEAGGGQHGLSFDDFGHRFACNNSDHIRLFMYDDRYAARNPVYAMPPGLISIAVDGPAAEVYRISPEEPWRVIRTRWRVSGLVSGPIEGGGRSAGYFTGATGTTIYRGDAFPPEYSNNAFIGDAGGNLVHRKVLQTDAVGLKGQRGPGEDKTEFAASRDTWFRPVQFANGPDGALYVIDMYREVIEHPWSLPENIKRFLDLNSGNDRGRIYRIVPEGFKQPKPPRLSKASTAELVRLFESANGWHRDTAARLLYERQDKTAIPPLRELMQKSKARLARLHALYALDGLGAFDNAMALAALNDPEPLVREHAIKLSEKLFQDGVPPAEILARLTALANDPSINVRYQLAFTLGEVAGPAKIAPLTQISKRDLESSWSRAAVLSSLADGCGEVFAALASDSTLCETKAGQDLLRQLVLLVGARNNEPEVGRVIDFISSLKERALMFTFAQALGDGLHKAGRSLSESRISSILALARTAALDPQAEETSRVPAIQLLGLTGFTDSGKALLSLLNLKEAQNIQLAAVSSLGRFNDPGVAPALIQHWDTLTPRLRSEAVTVLLARPDRATALLQAVSAGTIRASVLDSSQVKFLRTHKDKRVRELALKSLETKSSGTRQQVIDAFTSAVDLKGDVAHGKKIYEERCISCHRSGGEGHALGPDLVTVKNTGREKLLVNILDPNREVRPEFVSYVVETKDDESLIGLVANETSTAVTIRQAYSKQDTIARSNITKMQSQGQSLMPEGLEAGLTPQDLADLLAYIETAEAK